MAIQRFTNNAKAKLVSLESIGDGQSALFITPDTVQKFAALPNGESGDWQMATINQSGNIEIVKIVASSAGDNSSRLDPDCLIIERAQEGTLLFEFTAGADVYVSQTAAFLNELVTIRDKQKSAAVITSTPILTPLNTNNLCAISALAEDLLIIKPDGTLDNGQEFVIRIKDDGTSRAITYEGTYRAMGVTLPTATVANKTLYMRVIRNAQDKKFDVISVINEA